MTEYFVNSQFWMIKDSPERLDFHARTGDYFSYAATLVGFLEEALAKCSNESVTEEERAIARELRHDLRYMQANYSVSERPLSDIGIIRPSGNLLAK